MSRLRQEWDLIPRAAFMVAGVAYLAYLVLMAFIWFPGRLAAHHPVPPMLVGFFLLTAVAGLFMVAYILLVGYVWADAKRRQMNAVLWLLLAIFIPNAIGIILYFILRDPVPVSCPACETPSGKDQAFCAACGTSIRRACPQCRQPVRNGWTHCGHCGATLEASAPGGAA